MTGWFFGGMAVGVFLSFIMTLLFDKPTTVINGKNKVKKGGEIDYKLNTDKDGIFKRVFGRRKRLAGSD